ncbi:MAG: dihydrodipicolinate reductase [Armatimonadota bacterium]|nr:dihydrodipicolinate reductase [Armatimonadota bacterium]MDR5697320.1 dihydrodipicolinate reductase [Armatimonadota bacterium]
MRPLRVVQYGLGPIGLGIARVLLARPHIELIGAVDVAPEKVGRDLGELLGREAVGIPVVPNVREALEADVVVHATQSHLHQVESQLLEIFAAGADVVSTCEELAYPWFHHAEAAHRLDVAACEHGVTVTGVGVNPGFVMDLLPVVLTAPCAAVRRVVVQRRVDAARRRTPLQRKVGVGLTEEEFRDRAASGGLGHVGLPHSVAMIAAALGWEVGAITDRVEPVLAEGGSEVAGLHQVASGIGAGEERIRLELTVAVGAEAPTDVVRIEGEPSLSVEIVGGLHGDVATCAIAANAIPTVRAAPAGLRTVIDLPPIRCAG